jgi:hypothetical protein
MEDSHSIFGGKIDDDFDREEEGWSRQHTPHC